MIRFTSKVLETFSVLDMLKLEKTFAIAFSGGKDSTLLSILVYDWLRERGIKGKKIVFVHNDTQSELDILEEYARYFLNKICGLIRETGNECNIMFTVPTHNFYWRVIVAGYPAPNFIFRWCVNHLKVLPNKEAMKKLVEKYGRVVLLTGHREDESSVRASIIKNNSVCDASSQSCNSSFFLKYDVKDVVKVMPIRHWTLDDVWEYLSEVKDEFGLDPLYRLYGDNKVARYGCWHCTLVKIQKNIYNLPARYYYLEGARIIYRVVSDLEEMRMVKSWGRTKLGPLNAIGRGVMLKVFPVVEELSGMRLYGLDEAKIDGYSLREVFYELEPEKANELIQRSSNGIRLVDKARRLVPIEEIREVKVSEEMKERIVQVAELNDAYKVLSVKGKEYFLDILNKIE